MWGKKPREHETQILDHFPDDPKNIESQHCGHAHSPSQPKISRI
jgi:hypothetical protein